ncbi:hybrid sensor histidine kinase/response regulator [Fuerstiella marisgermanici]|uniref:Sensory/regulatory protein RpfC n=1 Tax=Fuerstiella marisgermanici TaxID=1891926 RepID=A0A1P8WE33_9PLAN|nr:response regulator [Fuerstiella marisgermanici]APZ92299.1 Signal transduction histidine-protein kinase BarA [Fuerstiella marisgermanici]
MTEQDSPLLKLSLSRQADLSHMSRRVRLLAALTELPQKQREDFSKAVTDVCRYVLAAQAHGAVEFSLSQDGSQHYLQIVVRNEGEEKQRGNKAPRAAERRTEEARSLERLKDVVDYFHFDDNANRGTIAELRQMLPPTFQRPTAREASLWKRMIQQKSLEDAILVASQRSRRIEAEADTMRQRHTLRDEMARGTEDSETLFSLIASETDNFIVVMDPDGSITWVNNAFVAITGYSEAEINRRRLDELLGGPSSNREVMRDFREALRHGHRFNDELLLYRKDGRAYWTHFTLTPVTRGTSGISRWIAIGTDVSQQRQAVDALAAAKESAESASQAKSEFLANMSHEIRTPLNAIIGMTELTLGTELQREQKEYLSTVKLSAESLLELLNDVLDLSKIEAGKLSIDHTNFNIADLIRDTVRALAVRAHTKGLELACHVPLDTPQWLRGDPVRLRQILVNLVGNAIKFTRSGEVSVNIEPQWQNGNEIGLHFIVSDTGVGIPKDRLQRIFDAFEQVDNSTTREYGGTGLGLAITSQLLRMMGGRIWVESQQGKGSRFHFSLSFPIVHDAPPLHNADAADVEGFHVLVVDDNKTNRDVVGGMLRHWKMEPTLVDSGRAALQEIEQHSQNGRAFDLVLLDAIMPELDGFEVAQQIRDAPDLECGTMMMLSSADRPNSSARCQELGIESFMLKPVSPSALLNAILSAVGPKRLSKNADNNQASPNDRPPRTLRVLVADDHEANRDLATAILTKRSHQCVPAETGRDVLREYESADPPFDAILMDVQMPEMDGFEVTTEIREREQGCGRHTPIIALTAHAMKGDREKCLAQGMDAYLSKPIRPRELVTLVESVASAGTKHEFPKDDPIATTEIDFTFALERLEGEDDLLRSQMQYFLNDGPGLVKEICQGLSNSNTEKIQRAAHRLKGLLAGYGRDATSKLAGQMEHSAATGDTSQIADLCNQVNSDVEALVVGMRKYLKT